ncbi:terpene synthase family protein [Streptomyces phaeochromogenes]|uniref:terpene synthase family protein n=1 Tax=Streptomyces phaeochromogenes TaxID=1923 RepID=UPI0034008C7F
MAWINDVHSVAKDLVLGEPPSLVTVLAAERGLSPQAAGDTAYEMLAAAVEDLPPSSTGISSTAATRRTRRPTAWSR